MIARIIYSTLQDRLFSGKAIVLTGPRQVGKTTLIRQLTEQEGRDTVWLNGDDPETRNLLADVNVALWRRLIGGASILVLDEAQRIPDIGIKLKLITDQLSQVQLIVSGSSALELAGGISEPLTGRMWHYHLYPLSFAELENENGLAAEHGQLATRLVYGYYPDVVTHSPDERELLAGLTDNYLFKDVLSYGGIRKPEKLVKLLQALAYQLGSEVSYHELGQIVDLDNQTVESYIQLLERAFVIYRLPPLSRNLRKELKTKRKIYFYDNGIRNAIISQFQPFDLRQDKGPLWENFLLTERLKTLHYNRLYANRFFWRTKDGQEIDYVEERDGCMWAYEFKWSPKRQATFSASFLNAYPEHATRTINPTNYFDFLSPHPED